MSDSERFEYRLCRDLRQLHPDFLLDQLTPQQFAGWKEWYASEPVGEERADLRMARIVWAILQTHSKATLSERKYLFDFARKDAAEISPENYKRRAMAAWTGAGGGLTMARE